MVLARITAYMQWSRPRQVPGTFSTAPQLAAYMRGRASRLMLVNVFESDTTIVLCRKQQANLYAWSGQLKSHTAKNKGAWETGRGQRAAYMRGRVAKGQHGTPSRIAVS